MAKLTPKKKALFCQALAEGGSVSKAASAVGVSRNAMYKLRKRDEEFAQEWDDAVESGTDVLEDEAVRRAKEGTDKPVFYQGVECGRVREYSDTLLIFMLKARRPEKFRDGVVDKSEGVNQLAELVETMKAEHAKRSQ